MSTPRPRALVTLPDIAAPADSGRRLRSQITLDGLYRLFDLDIVFLLDRPHSSAVPVPAAMSTTRRKIVSISGDTQGKALARLAARRVPWTLANIDWNLPRREILEWVDPAGYDLAWYGAVGHCLALAPYVACERSAVDVDDLESVKWRGYLRGRPSTVHEAADYLQRVVERPMWRRTEKQVARKVDAMVLSNPDDVDECRQLGISNTYVMPNTYPDPGRILDHAPARPPVLAFVANFVHGPNYEAAHVLVRDVMPALRRVVPEASLRLVGRGSEAIMHLGSEPGVNLVGAVDEVKPYLEDALAIIVPIRFGGGTRLKVLEALALGVPVISSSIGIAGLGAVDGDIFLRAETTDDYVRCTLRLLEDPDLRVALCDAGRRHYEKGFTPDASAKSIAELVEDVTDTGPKV